MEDLGFELAAVHESEPALVPGEGGFEHDPKARSAGKGARARQSWQPSPVRPLFMLRVQC